jgi:2-polyprenyl-3-methyl-5-hydroxy-6-metoxy-1,4-benzoquinol methylase
MGWNGESYQRRFDELAATGADIHGEAAFVMDLSPASVLDAGCGTGRLAIELDRRGVAVVGVDLDPSMLSAARLRAPQVTWVESDLGELALGRTFDVVVMAGNVLLFTPAGTEAAVVAGCGRHVGAGGALVAGFQVGPGYPLATYDEHCAAAGLVFAGRWATWDRRAWAGHGDYAVTVHRRLSP